MKTRREFHDYCRKSQVHSLVHLDQPQTTSTVVFWLSVTLIGLFLVAYQSHGLIKDFTNAPTTTKVLVEQPGGDGLSFPALTVCLQRRFNATAARLLFNITSIDQFEYLSTVYFSVYSSEVPFQRAFDRLNTSSNREMI